MNTTKEDVKTVTTPQFSKMKKSSRIQLAKEIIARIKSELQELPPSKSTDSNMRA
jgi:hypothetical protein